jgi:transposase
MYGKSISKEILYDLYVTQKLTIRQISERVGKSYNTTRGMIITYGFYVRSGRKLPNTVKYNITKEFLEREYLVNGKSQRQIAQEVGCGETTIWVYLHEFGIPSKNTGQILKGKPFSLKHRNSLSVAQSGKRMGVANRNWKGGVATSNLLLRRSNEYVVWRNGVIRNKGKICSVCGKDLNTKCPCCKRKYDIHVHHIHEFADNVEKRLSFDDAVILCDFCHKLSHKK